MIEITSKKFLLCFRVYNAFRKNRVFKKKGFASLNSLAQMISKGENDSVARSFLKELKETGFLVEIDGFVRLDEKKFVDWLTELPEYQEIDQYYDDQYYMLGG